MTEKEAVFYVENQALIKEITKINISAN